MAGCPGDCALAAQAKEGGAVPLGSGNLSSNNAERAIGFPSVLEALLEHRYGVSLSLELSDQERPRKDSVVASLGRRAGVQTAQVVVARSLQQSDIGAGLPWFRSKSIDTFCPLGPVIALPDEMPWPLDVNIELRVNGEVRQKFNTSRFIFSIPEVLSFVTRYLTLVPGDVVSTGTPEGSTPMAPGDVVEIEVPEIGILRNPVAPAGARVLG